MKPASTETKKVVAKVTFEMLFNVPIGYTPEDFRFRFNEGTFCTDNVVDWLKHFTAYNDERGGCTCNHTEVEFVRDATAEDIEDFEMPRDIEMRHDDETP